MNNKLTIASFKQLINVVDEGIHIVDVHGVTRYYNKAMEQIEGQRASYVMGKHILDAYPGWQADNSTLLTALNSEQTVHRPNQTYLNMAGRPIATVNTTMPLYSDHQLIGAMEISNNVTEVSNLSEEVIKLRQQLIKPKKLKKTIKHYSFDMLIGDDPRYLSAIALAKKAARTASSVLIYGETGTGKELFAQSIHYESNRADKPFLAVNCAALPESLLEGTLFGTTKGSFTGAVDRPGLFEQANGGTLFLDELNSMSLNLQSKLLRVLQENYIRRIGGLKDIAVDVRIIAATNRQPSELLNHGELRKDLYYRINVLGIDVPSLRDRPRDIHLLVNHFLQVYNIALEKNVWYIEETIMQRLIAHPWRGNVRELQNFIESTLNLVDDEHVITRDHLAVHWHDALAIEREQVVDEPVSVPTDLNRALTELEIQLISDRLKRHHGNISQTAQSLGISRQNLQYKLKKYQLMP